MNYKQKLGYMALGAGLLAVGIIIGQWGTPDIEAQSNGVFDKIACREIEVIDKDGNEAIRLYTTKHGGDIRMYSKDGRIASMGITEYGGSVYLSGKGNNGDGVVSMDTSENTAHLKLNNGYLDRGIEMGVVNGTYAFINVANQNGRANMPADSSTAVYVSSKDREGVEMTTDEHGGRIRVYKPDVATAYMSKIIWSAP